MKETIKAGVTFGVVYLAVYIALYLIVAGTHEVTSRFIEMEEYTVEEITYSFPQTAKVVTTEADTFQYATGWVRGMGLHKGSKFVRPVPREGDMEILYIAGLYWSGFFCKTTFRLSHMSVIKVSLWSYRDMSPRLNALIPSIHTTC